jgi:hypothetical protein
MKCHKSSTGGNHRPQPLGFGLGHCIFKETTSNSPRAKWLHPEARNKHSATQRRHEAAKRAWRSSPNPAPTDEAVYSQQIHPRLMSVTISAISSALGISESYAADIRAGRHRPHQRHWHTLAKLVDV